MTMYWAPFLHIYQPPWQDVEVLRRINKECYIPLLRTLERHPNARITLNVQGCLLNLLKESGLQETIDLLRKNIVEGKIEVVGSGMYHPILPLIPRAEIDRQIELNEIELAKELGVNWKPNGFFPPEMAVSQDLCSIVQSHDYKWMIMGGIANNDDWPHNYVQRSECGMMTFFRDDLISNEISFNKIDAQGFVNKIGNMYNGSPNNYVITAQDGETFGHHIPFYETRFLGKCFSLIEDRPDIEIVFISELSTKFEVIQNQFIKPSTWSTDASDLASNVPYPLWKHPFNPIHKVQYRMLKNLYLLMELVETHKIKNGKNETFLKYYETARWFYDESLSSCWLWWAAMRPMWSPNLIYKGADLIMRTALNAQLALINLQVGEGDELYQSIIDNMDKLMIKMIDQEISFRKIRTF